jgi:cytochrome P450
MNFILVMILHPDVQQKAHKLVDSVVGQNRLPTFHDRPSMPYIDAILRECMRWRPIFPLGALLTSANETGVLIHDSYHACCC